MTQGPRRARRRTYRGFEAPPRPRNGFAERDRGKRTEIWGILNRLRSGQEKVSIESSWIAEQGRRLQLRLEDLRLELAPLTLDVGESGSASERPGGWSKSSPKSTPELPRRPRGCGRPAEGRRPSG